MNYQEFIETCANSHIVFAKFSSSMCPPCSVYKPIFEEFDAAHEDIVCLEINCDNKDELDIAQQFGVKKLPTTIVFTDGVETARYMGICQLEELNDYIPV